MLPEANEDNRRVFSYLRKRGIAYQVIENFINAGLLYEDKQHHNCIFVGWNLEGKAVFANKRGTYDRNGVGYKGDVAGADKNIAFRLPCNPQNNSMFVFESPIDLMSYQTLHRNMTSNAVALCCLHDGALEQYLLEYPHINTIHLLLDSDEWGQNAADMLIKKYSEKNYTVTKKLPPKGKDWNEYLKSKYTRNKERSDNHQR